MVPTHQVALMGLCLFAYSAFSARLTRRWLTAPLVFTAFGLVTGSAGFGWLAFEPDAELIRVIAEITLVLLLFVDASQIRLRQLERNLGVPGRLLGIGMPLTIVLGTGVAMLLFPSWSLWEAALVATILAPTDAALGQPVLTHPSVPPLTRQALTVESGLNDGIALPLVLVLLGLASADVSGGLATFWLLQVTLGPVVGAVVGFGSAWLLRKAERNDWADQSFLRIGSLTAAGLCYLTAEAVGGNGFMAAFVGGLAFGTASPTVSKHVLQFLEVEGQLLMLAVFVLLGCVFAGPALADAPLRAWGYGLLSLTVIRMLPVLVSMGGTGEKLWPKLFLGWFGPRGLASLLFGMLLVEHETLTSGRALFDVVVITVLLSIVLHRLTAAWGAERFARWAAVHGRKDARREPSATVHEDV